MPNDFNVDVDFDFIKQFNLEFDVIINNKENTAFWLNEFKNV